MLEKPSIGSPCNGCGLCCLAQVCSAGSYAMGMVDQWGDRAPGPCPALRRNGDVFSCGLVERPKDFIQSDRGVTVLRDAMKILIGAGAGCDEAGDEPDITASPKLRDIQRRYVESVGERAIRRAAAIILEGKE